MDETINVTITEEQIVINAEVTAAGPPGPPGQDATLPQTATQQEMEAGTEAALRMMSPALVAAAIAALAPAGGGGAGGMWEKVLTQEVTVGPVQEIRWNGLDFDTYDYLVTGVLFPAGVNSRYLKWYAEEASIGDVVTRNRSYYGYLQNTTVNNINTTGNYLSGSLAFDKNAVYRIFTGLLFQKQAGQICLTNLGDYERRPSSLVVCRSGGHCYANTPIAGTPDHLGIYSDITAELGVGSKMTLWRRAK